MKYQQGDVIIKDYEDKIEGKVLKTNVVIESNITSHKHQLVGGKVSLRKNSKDELFLNVTSDTKIVHEEHKEIDIPKGKYKITFVREYDHFTEEARQVID